MVTPANVLLRRYRKDAVSATFMRALGRLKGVLVGLWHWSFYSVSTNLLQELAPSPCYGVLRLYGSDISRHGSFGLLSTQKVWTARAKALVVNSRDQEDHLHIMMDAFRKRRRQTSRPSSGVWALTKTRRA